MRMSTRTAVLALLGTPLLGESVSREDVCTWDMITDTPTVGAYCSDFDVGHVYDASKVDPVEFGKQTCATAPSSNTFDSHSSERAFFYGTWHGQNYVWCSNTCASGCCSGDFVAGYRRHCDGPAPSPPPAPVASGKLGKRRLVNQTFRGAACLDGSAPGYWIRTAEVDADSSRWVLHAQGGGWCYNEKDCAGRAKGSLGSSKGWGETTSCYGNCDGILSEDAAVNPDFYGWNAVWIGYCDGTSMSGHLKDSHDGLQYRGRANLDAVLDDLLARGMDKASDVVFTGGSAGGLAVFFNVDHVAKRVHEHSPSAKVAGLADAGFFLDHQTFGKITADYTESMKYLFNMSAASTDSDCLADLGGTEDAWKCFLAQYVQTYVTSPLFIAEGMYDSWQVNNILKLKCGHPTPEQSCSKAQQDAFFEYGQRMNETLAMAVGSNRGAFISACIVHCQTVFNEGKDRWSAWKINGVTPSQAFANFYFGNSEPFQLFDAQQYPSNPSCPVWTLAGAAGSSSGDLQASLV